MAENSVFLDERITKKHKHAFGLAGFGITVLSSIGLSTAINLYYNTKLGLSGWWISLAWGIFAVWNALNDPLFGIWEEKTKTKIGRRIPYLRYGAPFLGITFIFCWFPMVEWLNFYPDTDFWLFMNLLLVLFLFDSFFTMLGLITYTLPAEMAITQKGRSQIQVYNLYYGAAATLVAMVIPMVLLTGDELHPAFKPVMILLGVLCSGLITFSSYFLVENEYAVQEESLSFFKSIAETFRNKAFLIFEVSNFFYTICNTIVIGMMGYFVKYVMHLEGIMASLPLIGTFIMVFAFTIPASKMVAKYGLKKVYIVGLIISSIGILLVFLSGMNIVMIFVTLAIFGITYAPVQLANAPIMHDIIDQDELLTGKRRETTYAGMNALITKPAISVANIVFYSVIGAFGFDEDLDVLGLAQAETVPMGIRIAFTLVPMACLLIALLAMVFYPLDGPSWKQKKVEINQIHMEKERAYIKKLAEEGKISTMYEKLK